MHRCGEQLARALICILLELELGIAVTLLELERLLFLNAALKHLTRVIAVKSRDALKLRRDSLLQVMLLLRESAGTLIEFRPLLLQRLVGSIDLALSLRQVFSVSVVLSSRVLAVFLNLRAYLLRRFLRLLQNLSAPITCLLDLLLERVLCSFERARVEEIVSPISS